MKDVKVIRARRRGPPPKGEPGARERILATAGELFYQQGIRAIGVDTIVERSGISKTSLYRTFASKDALVEAFILEKDAQFWLWWDQIEGQHSDDPRRLLAAILSGISARIGRGDYRGCPFLNLATEFRDHNHPGRSIARSNKDKLRTRFARILRRLKVSSSNQVAVQITLLINGAYASAQIGRIPRLERNISEAVFKLIR